MLTKEIILPPYQRAFVWTEEDVKDLINSLKDNLFIPPITIGNYNGTTNYILDGQQRLSAILIAYLGLFPKKEEFKFSGDEYQIAANENDDLADEEDMPLEWQLSYFTQEGQDKQSILQGIDRSKYNDVNFELGSDFWRDTYMGFSLIIPISSKPEEQQKLYSSVFRNINIKGKSLSSIESRKSLYFLKEGFYRWFSPQFAYMITVNKAPIDFVRYLSLLSQYKKNGGSGKLAQNYKTKMEKYYESYILTEVNNDGDSMFTRLLGPNIQDKYQALDRQLQSQNFPKTFSSIIDADVYLFGLIYYTIANDNTVSIMEALCSEIGKKIQEFKSDSVHIKSPSALEHLRKRIHASIDIYGKYLSSNNEA